MAGIAFLLRHRPYLCRGDEGITPEQFWANSEHLIGLAKGGDRGAFEGVIEALITRNKKMNASSPCAGGTESRSGSGAAGSEETPTGGGKSPSSTEGHDGGQDPWQPGGPEVHAVLGATGERESNKEGWGSFRSRSSYVSTVGVPE